MNTTNYIRIFRGDDSDALGYQTIVGTIKTDLDLTGCKAVFRFLGFYAEFDPIPEDKKLTIVVPAQASRGFPPGVGYASLKVLDALGKIRTFTNRIPVIVDTMTPSCGCGEFEVSFSPFPELEPLKIFVGPNANDFDQYTGFISKIIDRASLVKYGLAILVDAMSEDSGASGKAASPAAVKAAYDAIITTLTDNYYNAEQTEEAIDRVAAYYITRNAAGDAFETKAQLDSTTVFYSGGKVRTPTRNDYCVVLADETHEGAEYRYIYAVADGETTGSWQPQFPVEGVMTVDQTVTKDSQNPVSGGGVWKALWGTATTAFSSLYDWCVAQLAGKASKADATLTSPYWTIDGGNPSYTDLTIKWSDADGHVGWAPFSESYGGVCGDAKGGMSSTELSWTSGVDISVEIGSITATRSAAYQLGSQSDKPLASEAEAEALRNGKLDKSGGTVTGELGVGGGPLPNFQVVPEITEGDYIPPTMWFGDGAGVIGITWRIVDGSVVMDVSDFLGATHRIALPSSGGTLALSSAIPYSLGTPITIDTVSLETVEGETVNYGAATLADRTANIVQVTAATALDELRITFPAATSGKVRDFGLRVEIGTGSAALAAPALVPIAPTGETIKIENNAHEIPALADGTATAKGVTLLYFSENAPGIFVVKGEQVEEVA